MKDISTTVTLTIVLILTIIAGLLICELAPDRPPLMSAEELNALDRMVE